MTDSPWTLGGIQITEVSECVCVGGVVLNFLGNGTSIEQIKNTEKGTGNLGDTELKFLVTVK